MEPRDIENPIAEADFRSQLKACDHKKLKGADGLYFCCRCGIPMRSKIIIKQALK